MILDGVITNVIMTSNMENNVTPQKIMNRVGKVNNYCDNSVKFNMATLRKVLYVTVLINIVDVSDVFLLFFLVLLLDLYQFKLGDLFTSTGVFSLICIFKYK